MNQTSEIHLLVQLSKIDIALGKLIAERREAERGLSDKLAIHKKITDEIKKEEKGLALVKAEYTREETDLKYQQQKITDRRKALMNLPGAKAQTAGAREIDGASKQLLQREEALLELLEKMEQFEKKLSTLRERESALLTEITDIQAGIDEHLKKIAEQQKEQEAERKELTDKISPDFLTRYQTVLRKYTLDPVVSISSNTCTGCYINLVPQVALKVATTRGPIQCPGCSRILFLENKDDSASKM